MNPLSLEDYTEREALKARVAQLEARIKSALEAAAECIEMGADYRYAAECVADCLKEDA
jgi:hypothetical protein